MSALLATTRRHGAGIRNVFMPAVIAAFTVLGIVGWFWNNPNVWLARNACVVGAGLYAAIFLVSLAFTPVVEYYTRLHVRKSMWTDRRFTRVNVALCLLWASALTAIAVSQLLGPMINRPSAYTTFNWVVPIAILTVAAHWTRICWENLLEDDGDQQMSRDPLWDLEVDWHVTPNSLDR